LVADFEEGAGQPSPGLNHPVAGATIVTSNVWHHAAATYDGTTWRLFLDGNQDGTLVVSRSPRSDSIQHAGLATAMDSTGTAPGLGTATFTIETWFKREGPGIGTSTGSGGIADGIPLVTKGRAETDGSNVDMNYFLGIRASDGVLIGDFEDTATGANHPVAGVTSIATGATWHHAAATYDGSTWRLYLDGNLETALTLSGSPTPRSDS